MKHKDKLKGGVADKMQPSSFDKKKLKEGTKHETEHTKDKSIAQEITMDHLAEDANYYKKLKSIEKYDRVEVTADGKMERDYGVEPLDKDPIDKETKQKIKDKWKKLRKAALDSSKAIIDIRSQEAQDEEAPTPPAQETQSTTPEEAPQEEAPEGSEEGAEGSQAQDSDEEPVEGEEPTPAPSDEEELARLLQEDGYSDDEILHIIHGHSPPIPTQDDHAAANEEAKGDMQRQIMQSKHDVEKDHKEDEHKLTQEHRKRMHDVEYEKARAQLEDPISTKEHAKKLKDIELEIENAKRDMVKLEVEHKKRMLDLEYEKAHKEINKSDPSEDMKKEQLKFDLDMQRMEKEMELKYKEKELQLGLELKTQAAKLKSKLQEQQMKDNTASAEMVEVKQTPAVKKGKK